MSILLYQNRIMQKRRELERLSKDKSDEMKKISNFNNKISSAQRTLKSTKSASTVNSKNREIQKALDEIAKINKKISDIETRISRKQKELFDAQNCLTKEMEKEDKKREKENQRKLKDLNDEIERQAYSQHNLENRITKIEKLPRSINVLIMTSNPIDTNQLRLDEEVRSITEMIRKSAHRDSVKLESRWATRTIDILQAINEVDPTIVHFSGHGASNGDIFVQNNDGTAKNISKEAMVQVLKSSTDKIKLVFFNSCFSYLQAEAVTEQIPCAIGMSDSIGDKAAEVFAAQFYSAIGFGKSVKEAFEQAKAALMLEGINEENIPALYIQDGINAEDLYIVEGDK